jgi:hypothetical protein
MRQFSVIIEQLNLSKKLILENDTASLRMALILLDNAAEILMYRKVLSEFHHNEFYEKLRGQAKSFMPSDIFDKFITEHSVPEVIEEKNRRKILKYFDEKITFLCDNIGLIPSPSGAVLSSLHKYRNETYHRDMIRNEILRPIALLYFELVSNLIIHLQQGATSYHSEDDWSNFFTKYGLGESEHKLRMLSDADIEAILNGFRAELSITLRELEESLREYVLNRLNESLDRLDFISEALGNKDLDIILKLIQFTETEASIEFNNRDLLLQSEKFSRFTASVTIGNFLRWKEKAQTFAALENKLTLFITFKKLEDEFEAIEHKILDVADELDSAIQLAIDIARGK